MQIYHYDHVTKIFTGTTQARPDPLEYQKMIAAELASRLTAKQDRIQDLREKAQVILTNSERTQNLPAPQKFLLPANATFDAPPSVVPPDHAAYFIRGVWNVDLIPVPEPAPTPEEIH